MTDDQVVGLYKRAREKLSHDAALVATVKAVSYIAYLQGRNEIHEQFMAKLKRIIPDVARESEEVMDLVFVSGTIQEVEKLQKKATTKNGTR